MDKIKFNVDPQTFRHAPDTPHCVFIVSPRWSRIWHARCCCRANRPSKSGVTGCCWCPVSLHRYIIFVPSVPSGFFFQSFVPGTFTCRVCISIPSSPEQPPSIKQHDLFLSLSLISINNFYLLLFRPHHHTTDTIIFLHQTDEDKARCGTN